jgi:hypothetical protein
MVDVVHACRFSSGASYRLSISLGSEQTEGESCNSIDIGRIDYKAAHAVFDQLTGVVRRRNEGGQPCRHSLPNHLRPMIAQCEVDE